MAELENPNSIIRVKDLKNYHDTLIEDHVDATPTKDSVEMVQSGGVYNYVNTSVATSSAAFLGTSASGLTEQQFLTWAASLNAQNNDYCYWKTTDLLNKVLYKRYKYDGTSWVFEYV